MDEEGGEEQADGDRDDVLRVPALGGDLLEAVDHGQDGGHRQRDARPVEAAGGGVLGLREQERAEDQQQCHRGQVDQEDRAPPEVLDEDTAHHRAEGDASGHHAGPQADRLRALAGVGEHPAQQRHRGRHQGRAADAEDRAGGDEGLGAGRVGRDDGGGTEGGGADQEEPAVADAVAERAHRHQQAGQDEGVDVEDPQLLGAAGLQVRADRRDGEVEDGDVHRDEQQGEHQDAESGPFAAAGTGVGGARGVRRVRRVRHGSKCTRVLNACLERLYKSSV